MPLARALLTGLIFLMPALAQAACSGPSLVDRLTAEQRADLERATARMSYGEGLFWTARKADRQITLAGTMHLFDDRHALLLDRMAAPLAEAGLLLTEMAPGDETAMQRAMARDPSLVFITDGPTLPERLSEDDWQELAEAARDRQMPGVMAAKSQPWFLSMTLSIPPCAMGDLIAGKTGLDHMIMDRAEAEGVPIASLEDWRTIPSHFQAIPMEDQIDMLRMALMAPDLQEEAFVAMLDSYFAGRVAEIWELSRLSIELLDPAERAAARAGFEMTEDLLLDARNAAWLPVILDAAERHDRVVVAAGAAHLPGETGILALLEAEGWQISPLP